MITPPRPRSAGWLVAGAILLVGTLPLVRQYLLLPDDQHWLVDLQVYREAGVSNLTGRPVYDYLTLPPQNLPFTYPPFASILAIPLALLPFRVLGWIWFALQLGANLAIVRIAAGELLARLGRSRGVVWGALALAITYLLPVADGLRFGQVNAFLVLACLIDVVRPDLARRIRLPQGALVGLATAIKLTPGVFIVGYLVNRQWRAAATAIGTTAAVTVGAFVLLPGASLAYWGGALQDSGRLGRNDGTANQSLRAVLLRHLPEGAAREILWVVLVLLAVLVGYAAARRAVDRGDRLLCFSLVAVIGLVVSPVSWTHHFHWLVPTICLLIARGVNGSRGLAAAGAALWLTFVLHLTWWAHWRLVDDPIYEPARSTGDPLWTVLHNAYAIAGVLTLLGLVLLAARLPAPARRPRASSVPDGPRPGSPSAR